MNNKFNLGVAYNVFSGLELLEANIKQLRDYTNYIVCAYQYEDYFGNKIPKEDDLDILFSLRDKGLIDDLILFNIDKPAENPYEAKLLEIEKRNLLKEMCIRNNCNFILCLDVDEFFIPEDFIRARDFIIERNFDYTACKIVDYYNKPIFQKVGYNKLSVPFICKILPNQDMGNKKFFTWVDSTRTYQTKDTNYKTYLFPEGMILMHHMRGVRKNIRLKWISSSQGSLDRSHQNIDNIVKSIRRVSESRLKLNDKVHPLLANAEFRIVPNYFDIPYEEW